MRLNFYQNDAKKTIELRKINIFYGYANSGKSVFADELHNGLQGKDKSYTINGISITKEEKNVIFIDSKESILDHIKLSSKSYLKKYYYDKLKKYLDEHSYIINNINDNLKELNTFLLPLVDEFNNKTSLAKIEMSFFVDNNEEIINNFMKILISTDSLSSTAAKELLLMLITILNDSEKETHIIIDDFDSFLDEQTTIKLLKQLDEFDGYIYLFTNKPNSILYSIGKYGIFNIRKEKLFDFTNVLFLLKKALENEISIENQTYEEYMINFGYLENSGMLDKIYTQIKANSIYNFGRILTSEIYKITNTIDFNTISIIPSSREEEMFLIYIDALINDN